MNKLPLTCGKVHFIRRVDNDGQINVLNETFSAGKEFTSEYVWATICLRKQRLEVYYRAQDQDVAVLIKEFGYDANEESAFEGKDLIWLSKMFDINEYQYSQEQTFLFLMKNLGKEYLFDFLTVTLLFNP